VQNTISGELALEECMNLSQEWTMKCKQKPGTDGTDTSVSRACHLRLPQTNTMLNLNHCKFGNEGSQSGGHIYREYIDLSFVSYCTDSGSEGFYGELFNYAVSC